MNIRFIFKDEEVKYCIKPETLVQIKLAEGPRGPQGQDGQQGPQGEPGYTPVKGVDYFTEEDKTELLAGVEAEIDELDRTKANLTDIPDVSNFITKEVNNLTNYTLKTATGSLIDLEINQSTYVVTLSLKDIDGNVISTDTIDLPLESVVIGGRFDSVNKKIVLTLENGNTVDIPVGDLVAGLQTEITSSNKLASDLVDDTNSGNKFTNTSEKTAWNAKYDKPSGGIPKTDLASDVQTSLGKADTAIQEHQDISGKEDKSNKVTSMTGSSTDIQYPSAKCVYDSQAEQNTEIDALQAKVDLLESIIPTGTGSGESITITDSARYPFKEFNVGGNTKQATAILPDTYQQVDYIESSGTQYIDTGFKPTGDTSTIIDCIYTPLENSATSIFGCQNYQAPAYINVYNFGNQTSSSYNYVNKYNTLVNSYTATAEFYTGRKLYKLLKNKAYVDNTLINEFNYADFTCTYNAFLFAQNYNGVVNGFATMKLYSCKIYNNDTLVRNFIPCYRVSDSEVGLYDLVNNVFYTNAGTGTFTYGTAVTLPNPDFPIEVENVSGEVEVKVENKNLNDGSIVRKGYYNANGTFASNNTFRANVMKVSPNTRYALSTTLSQGLYNTMVLLDKNRNLISTISYLNKNGAIVEKGYNNEYFKYAIFTTPANCCYVSAGLLASTDEEYNNKVMLEPVETSATTPTSYEPHEEQTATLHLPEGMEMCKIGDYKDGFVYQGGKWYKNKLIGLSGASASWAWDKNQDSPDGNYISFMAYEAPWKKASVNSLCNYFITGYWNTIVGENGNYCWNNGSVVGGFRIHKDYLEGYDASMTNAQKIALFKTWLRNHSDLEVCYKLNTSVLEEITDTTLISDLNNLKDLYSYKGTTHISSTNEPSPVFEVVYRKSLG